jgi:hypothetical protein
MHWPSCWHWILLSGPQSPVPPETQELFYAEESCLVVRPLVPGAALERGQGKRYHLKFAFATDALKFLFSVFDFPKPSG